jgi:hypothetical protein
LDVLLFTHQLTNILGWQGPAIMYTYFFASGIVKRLIMPAFGKVYFNLILIFILWSNNIKNENENEFKVNLKSWFINLFRWLPNFLN